MKEKILSLINKLLPNRNRQKAIEMEDLDVSDREAALEEIELSSDLEENINTIKKLYGGSFDLVVRRIKVGPKKRKGVLIYIEGLVDSRTIEEDILKPLTINSLELSSFSEEEENIYEAAVDHFLSIKDLKREEEIKEITKNLSTGYTLILFDGVAKAILCETQNIEKRQIEEPEGEISLRGPRDGFVENIETNTSILRTRLRIPHLWFESLELGKLSKTNIVLAYIKGLADEGLVEEVKSRLEKIDIDNVLESGYLQEYITDDPYAIFPLIMRTERPDKIVSCLVEGKVAIITNGTPFVLVVPTTYNMLLQAPDDYYEPFPIGSFIRLMRHMAFLFSLLLPGVYVAIINYHIELVPITLLLRITVSREGVPFPILVEALIMETLFEILREAGLRLPKAIGSAVSIVGALILGEAAITAGLVSPAMVIVVALTAISSFATPDYSLAFAARILRFVFLFLGGTSGLFGIQFGLLLLLIHLCSLRSFGVPYFEPYGPLVWQDLKDSIVRMVLWKQEKRPKFLAEREETRQPKGQRPKPPQDKEGE